MTSSVTGVTEASPYDLPPSSTNPGWSTRRLHPTFGLEIRGFDAARPLDNAALSTLRTLSGQYKLLLLKDQDLSDLQLDALAQHFGDTDQLPPDVPDTGKIQERRNNVSRLGDSETSQRALGAPPAGYSALPLLWHSDSSWRAVPTWLSFLLGVELPSSGGATCFADMEAAYNALPDGRRSLLEGKNMIHSWAAMRRHAPDAPSLGENSPPAAVHPVVRTVDGRRSLYLSGHTGYYIGNMPFEEGKALYEELIAHATSSPYVYQHEWEAGDLLIWDNRTTMHRVLPHDCKRCS